MRITTLAMCAGMAVAMLTLDRGATPAQAASSGVSEYPSGQASSELSAQRRRIRRGPTRLRVYRSYSYPGPNAVRECTARYVQEFRPSGTVIVPRVNCFWRPG